MIYDTVIGIDPGKSNGYIAVLRNGKIDIIKMQVEKIMKDKRIGIRPSGFSPSQVLRGKINLLWQSTESDKDFDEYYKYWMNTIIQHFEKKISEHKS